MSIHVIGLSDPRRTGLSPRRIPVRRHEERDGQEYWDAAISVYERYTAPYTPETRPSVERMMNKRIVVKLVPHRVRSWDHGKLGLDPIAASGSTAAFIGKE